MQQKDLCKKNWLKKSRNSFMVKTSLKKHLKQQKNYFEKDKIAAGIDVVTFLAETKIFPSKGEARKTVQGGGVSINRKKIENIQQAIENNLLLHNKYILVQKGKKNYYLVNCN